MIADWPQLYCAALTGLLSREGYRLDEATVVAAKVADEAIKVVRIRAEIEGRPWPKGKKR